MEGTTDRHANDSSASASVRARRFVAEIDRLSSSTRIHALKDAMLREPRVISLDQARIITRVYSENEDEPVSIRRARSLAAALREMPLRIDQGELVVGNRTPGIRSGVVFPEAGVAWVDREIEELATRPQDRFQVSAEDITVFRNEILPFWRGRTLEDAIHAEVGEEITAIGKVVKINQTDHAQGHICPDTAGWLALGPSGLLARVDALRGAGGDENRFLEGVAITLEAAVDFILRYADLAERIARDDFSHRDDPARREELEQIAVVCRALATRPAVSFREAVQSVWFLSVILQMESNASSFSPGRMDQYLYPYFRRDFDEGRLGYAEALELVEALWLKFNQIVYLRNANSARYFAGFPIGFNVALGGQHADGSDASNELSFLFLKAQEHLDLPQPNLSVRLHEATPDDLLDASSRVIGLGSGMPQVFNDEAVVPALRRVGVSEEDARDYAVVGCVELSTHGNNLGWSDAAMFNLVKALEITLTGGVCLLTGNRLGPDLGSLETYETYEELERAFAAQIDHFVDRMIPVCDAVERIHADVLPSPFLSSVINDCLDRGVDVTAGGAHYNLSGIQAIQVANIADSLAAVKQLVYDERRVAGAELLHALRTSFVGDEVLRQRLLKKVPKYGNDVSWVDELGNRWITYFADRLRRYTNRRGGPYHAGLYTVSAHVPMGKNVGATADGRRTMEPLADGGMSAVYGRDIHGPTALLHSVSRIDHRCGSNGTLLNMKFAPDLFRTANGVARFAAMLRTLVGLKIIHAQFNVITQEDLLSAMKHPEEYRSLTVRVAGYTAYFTELAPDLQREIVARTSYSGATIPKASAPQYDPYRASCTRMCP